jgi:hypothetical protein
LEAPCRKARIVNRDSGSHVAVLADGAARNGIVARLPSMCRRDDDRRSLSPAASDDHRALGRCTRLTRRGDHVDALRSGHGYNRRPTQGTDEVPTTLVALGRCLATGRWK